MNNVIDKLAPNPVTHEHGENGCCPDPREWEMEMMHQVWAAGLHDAANCFQDALEAKWKLESQQKVKPKTNSDRIRAMTDEQLAIFLGDVGCCNPNPCKPGMYCGRCWFNWLKAPVEGSEK